ncbi:hypothetical protein [Paenibacillus chitinolyticus]|uniref:hypothetical protein n=1 Tax=Paenibacillus chitinolyticus TaxID=79263 RepID=UPI00366D1F17
MNIKKKALTINLVSVILGFILLGLTNESDPRYLQTAMMSIGIFAIVVGAYGVFKSIGK